MRRLESLPGPRAARGARGAAGGALRHTNDSVWIELSGLPPKRLPEDYARFDLVRLGRRWVFGTDWPGVPGIEPNARAVAELLPDEVAALVPGGNAMSLYAGLPDLATIVAQDANDERKTRG